MAFKKYIDDARLKELNSYDYSEHGIDEFKKYFDKKDIKPIDHEVFIRHHSMNTVGGVLREIGRRNDKEDVEYLLKIAMTMVRNMDARLQEYHLVEREKRKYIENER